MDAQPPALTQAEAEELAALLYAIEGGGNPDVPQNIQGLLRNVKRQKGDTSDEPQGEEVVPEPGFVVKTLDEHKRKVFLNICASPKVEPPASVANGQLPEQLLSVLDRLDVEGEKLSESDLESLRILLSCGDPRADADNKGEPCTTVDVVFNSDIIKQAAGARSLKYFIIQIATGWVAQKFGMQLDPKYTLPKMRYKGARVRPQRMRVVRKALVKDMGEVPEDPVFPLVTRKLAPKAPAAAAAVRPPAAAAARQGSTAHAACSSGRAAAMAAATTAAAAGVLPSAAQQGSTAHTAASSAQATPVAATAAAAGASPAAATAGQTSAATPRASRREVSGGGPKLEHGIGFEGKPVTALVVTVQLPDVRRGHDDDQHVRVECRPQQLLVSVRGSSLLQVALPFAVVAAGAAAVVEGGALRVQLPVRPLREVVQELRRAAPHAPGSLKLVNTTSLELD